MLALEIYQIIFAYVHKFRQSKNFAVITSGECWLINCYESRLYIRNYGGLY